MKYIALNWIGTKSAMEIILNGHNNATAREVILSENPVWSEAESTRINAGISKLFTSAVSFLNKTKSNQSCVHLQN
jgi:hypothetical protein